MLKLDRADTFIVDILTIRPHVLAMATMHAQSLATVGLPDPNGVDASAKARRSAASATARKPSSLETESV